MTKKNYKEGTVFAVPLSTGNYGIGVVSRITRSTLILAHFFPLLFEHVPTLEEIGALQSKDAILVLRTGGLGIIEGNWPILGVIQSWEKSSWPLPIFFREDPITHRFFAEHFNDDLEFVSEKPVNSADGLMPNSVYGHVIVLDKLEKQLTKLKIKI